MVVLRCPGSGGPGRRTLAHPSPEAQNWGTSPKVLACTSQALSWCSGVTGILAVQTAEFNRRATQIWIDSDNCRSTTTSSGRGTVTLRASRIRRTGTRNRTTSHRPASRTVDSTIVLAAQRWLSALLSWPPRRGLWGRLRSPTRPNRRRPPPRSPHRAPCRPSNSLRRRRRSARMPPRPAPASRMSRPRCYPASSSCRSGRAGKEKRAQASS